MLGSLDLRVHWMLGYLDLRVHRIMIVGENVLKFSSFFSQMINVFGLYWGLFFFTAFGELVLAGVFAEVNILPMHMHIIFKILQCFL